MAGKHRKTAIYMLGVLLLIAALFLSILALEKLPAYDRWVMDEGAFLQPEGRRRITEVNRELDRTYGSLIGFLSVESLNGEEIGSFVYRRFAEEGFGAMDMLILVSRNDRKWYLAYGDGMAGYADNELRLAASNAVTDALYSAQSERVLLHLYDTVALWYEKHVPTRENNRLLKSNASGIQRKSFGGVWKFVLTGIVLILLLRYLIVPGFRFPKTGVWSPWGGWPLLPLKGLSRPFVGGKTHKKRAT